MVQESSFALASENHGDYIQLSVIIPVYNQQGNVGTSLARIRQVLNSTPLSYEVVVVNDGSVDDTIGVLRSEAEKDQRIKVVSYSPNMGKGFAVKKGITKSRGEFVLFTDGDLDISPHIIGEYISQLESYDLVIASKAHPRSKVRAPASRRFLSRAFNLLVRATTGTKFRDTQAGLKVGNGETLRTIFGLMLVQRYAFDVEMMTIASILGLRVKEMPVEINLERRFKAKDILRMLADVIGISYRYRVQKWYQRQLEMQGIGR